jgi:rhodanese-related sulfurtransferase
VAASPNQRVGIDELLAAARERLRRLRPREAHRAAQAGGLIVDIRSEVQRDARGRVPGAHFVPRNVLEWRADPGCPHHDPVLVAVRGPLILMCAEGFQSSLAAATLQELGLLNATDMIGGFDRWCADGLPTLPARRGLSETGASPEP